MVNADSSTDSMVCPPHHLVIPSPRGNPIETATCKNCGYTKDQYVVYPEDWEITSMFHNYGVAQYSKNPLANKSTKRRKPPGVIS